MTIRKVSASSESGVPRLAFSYQRVSASKQAEEVRAGLDRQADAFLEFCQRHDLTPSADPLMDRGLRAFHDRHRRRGALGVGLPRFRHLHHCGGSQAQQAEVGENGCRGLQGPRRQRHQR